MKAKRKGWRKQPTSQGMMRLAPSYKGHGMVIQQQRDGRWFFYGNGHNSLCSSPPGLWENHIDAMAAAEACSEHKAGGAS